MVDKPHHQADILEEDDLAKVIGCRSVGSWSENRNRHVADCLKVAISVLHHANNVEGRMNYLRKAMQQASLWSRRLSAGRRTFQR